MSEEILEIKSDLLRQNRIIFKGKFDSYNYVIKIDRSILKLNKKLGIRDILLNRDLLKIKGHISEINNILGSNYVTLEELEENIEKIINNKNTYEIIMNNVFAGRVTVKFWKICDIEEDNLCKIKQKIKISDIYNKNLIRQVSKSNIESPTPYTCIELEDGKYIIRMLVPSCDKNTDNGVEIVAMSQNANIVCIIDLNNKYLEVRGNYKLSRKVAEKLNELFCMNIMELPILLKHSDNIEKFKNSFRNAKFTNVKSVPYKESPLTDEEINMLVSTLKALDEFSRNKNYLQLETTLKKIDINTNDVGFTHLLLTGLSKIGISSRPDNKNDITNQPMYKLLESYLVHQSGYLKIIEDDGSEHSIQIGLKTNNVSFNNSTTNEHFISMIRNKLIYNDIKELEEISKYMIDEYELEEIIRSMAISGIRSFYAEYLAKLKKIDVIEAFNLLYDFSIKTNKLKIMYEIRCESCFEELKRPVDNIQCINYGDIIICLDCQEIVDIAPENIYVRYHISEAWIKSIIKKHSLRLDIKEETEEKIKSNLSLAELNRNGILTNNKIPLVLNQTINIDNSKNTNYGVANSMGTGNKVVPAF